MVPVPPRLNAVPFLLHPAAGVSPTSSQSFPTHHPFSLPYPPPPPPNPFPAPAVPFLSSSPRGGEGRTRGSEGSRAHPPPCSPRTGAWVRMALSTLRAALSMVAFDPSGRQRRGLRGAGRVTWAPPCWLRLDQSSAAASPEQRRTERPIAEAGLGDDVGLARAERSS